VCSSDLEKGRLIDPPFFATMKVGGGKTAYIGSAETWRLRQAKEIFHDRFWVKLARYCSSGLTQEKRYGRILANTKALVGKMFLEAEVKGDDMLPLKTPSVKAELHRIDKFGDVRPVGFELKAKDLRRPDLAGWYDGNVELPAEGEYEIRIPITKTEAIKHTVWVKEPNTEKDHVRTNFPTLVKVSGDLTNVLNGLEGEVYARVKNRFEGSAGSVKGSAGEKLFLPLSQADILPDAIRNVPPRPATVKGKVEPFWAPADGKEPKGHHGLRTGLTVNAAWLAILLPLGVGLLGFAILSFIGQILNGVLFASGFSLLSLIMLIVWLSVDLQWPDLDVDISFILVTLVGLLGIEWLTRKLLKLA
jgi:hypothetical protein